MLARQKRSHRTAQWEPDSFLVCGSMGCSGPPGKAGPHCVARGFGSPGLTRTPCSLWKCSLARATCPQGRTGTCSGTDWGPLHAHPSPLFHASSVPGSLLLAFSQQAPHREAPGPSSPLPGVSRETLALQRQLCHRSGFPRAAGPARFRLSVRPSPPAAAFRVAAAFMGSQREERAVSRLHRLARCRLPRSRTRHPSVTPGTPLWDTGVQDGATLTLTMRDPHCTQQLRSAWGCLSLLPPGRAVGQMLGSSPHHFLWPRRW